MLVRDSKLLGKYHYAWAVMGACCILQAFGMGLVMNCGSLFYVPICDDLGFLRAEISTYMTGYFVGNTIMMPVAGWVLSKRDMRKVMAIAVIGLGVDICLMSTYSFIWQWQVAGLFVGVFGAFLFVLPAASLTGSWFVKHRGKVYGVVMASSGLSAAVFSNVINNMILGFGWRNTYLFVGIAVIMAILPCCLFFYNDPERIGAAPYGAEELAAADNAPHRKGVPTKTAIMSFSFVSLFLFAGIASFCHGGVNQHTPAYIQSIGFSSVFAATIVSGESIGSVFDKLVMGYFNDKIGVKWTAIMQFVIVIAGVVGFIFLRDPAILMACAVMLGVQDSLMSVSLPMLIRSVFGDANYTQIHAWIRMGVGIFGSFSGVLVGWVYDTTGSYVSALYIMAAVCVVGILCVFGAYAGKRHLVLEDWKSEDASG